MKFTPPPAATRTNLKAKLQQQKLKKTNDSITNHQRQDWRARLKQLKNSTQWHQPMEPIVLFVLFGPVLLEHLIQSRRNKSSSEEAFARAKVQTGRI